MTKLFPFLRPGLMGAALLAFTSSCVSAAAVVPCDLPLAPAVRASRVASVSVQIAADVAAFESRLGAGTGGLACAGKSQPATVHDFGDYAFAKRVVSANDPAAAALAESAIGCMIGFETPEGLFPFHPGDTPSLSDNSTEFAMLPLAALLTRFKVSPALSTALVPHIITGLNAIEQHPVCPAYTNICFMQTADMLALGQWLAKNADAATAAAGRAFVRSGRARLEGSAGWLAYTRTNGIHEFDSPTYNEVDLEVLRVALAAAPDDTVHAEVKAALDYLFTDLAANSFQPQGALAGPESRSYNFFTGEGGLSTSLYLEGLRDAAPVQLPDLTKAILVAGDDYLAPAAALCQPATREVRSTWGPGAASTGQERYAYLTSDYTLGTTSADYGTSLSSARDLSVRAQLAGPPTMASINVLPDYFDAPGTSVKSGDFDKVTHLLMAPAAAQYQGAALVLLDIPAKDPKYLGTDGHPMPLVNLGTHITLPADPEVSIAVDNEAVDPTVDTPVNSSRPTLTVKRDKGVIAVAVLDASGLDCVRADGTIAETGSAQLHVKPLLAASSSHGTVARLAIYHDLHPPVDTRPLASCFVRVALLIAGSHCGPRSCAEDFGHTVRDAAQAATVSFSPQSGDWDVRARVGSGAGLHVHRLVGKKPAVLAREVDAAKLDFGPLSVNGQAVVPGR